MKTAHLFCGSTQHGAIPCANTDGLTASHKLAHTHLLHLRRPAAAVETLRTVTSSFRGHWNITKPGMLLLSLVHHNYESEGNCGNPYKATQTHT